MNDHAPAPQAPPALDAVLPAGDDFQPLHPRARIGMRLGAVFGQLLLFLLPAAALLLALRGLRLLPAAPSPAWLLGLLALAALVYGWRLGGQRWQRTRWRLDPRGLEIHRGVYWQHQIRVPRSRVQHTDLHRGPLDRRWGMADLVIYTAGSEQAAVRLGGLPAAQAQALRDALLQGHDEQL